MSGFSTPPDGPIPEPGIYVPGSNPQAESYDVPEGSQGQLPDHQVTVSADSSEALIPDPGNPDYAFSSSPLVPGQPGYVQLSGTDFTEEDGYIVFDVDTEL